MPVDYDQTLDEPDEPERCERHDAPRPCQECKDQMADWTFDDWRDER